MPDTHRIVRKGGHLGEFVSDPFYSKANQQRLTESIKQLKNGQVVVKSIEELKAMEEATSVPLKAAHG